jgi:hypothetical protein
MKTIIYILIFIFSLASCTNRKSQNSEVQKEETRDKWMDLKSLNPEWYRYYSKRINHFKFENFQLENKWNEKELIAGTISGDFDSSFDKSNSQFLINSPDYSEYIDLDSYLYVIKKNEKSELICADMDVDQEINWVNRKTKQIKRICFVGPDSRFEDAKWVNNSTIALFGIDNKKLFITIVDLKNLDYESYSYRDTLTQKSQYDRDVRLKSVRFMF